MSIASSVTEVSVGRKGGVVGGRRRDGGKAEERGVYIGGKAAREEGGLGSSASASTVRMNEDPLRKFKKNEGITWTNENILCFFLCKNQIN